MNLQLNEKETQALIDLLSLAHWVTGHTDEESPKADKEHDALVHKLLGAANAEVGELEQLQLDSASWVSDKISSYDEETFWDELVFRLSMRDIDEVVGVEAFGSLPEERREELLDALEDFYSQLFEQGALEELKIEGVPSPLAVAADEIAAEKKATKKGGKAKKAAPAKKVVAKMAAPAKKAVKKAAPAKKVVKKAAPAKKVAKKGKK